MNLCLFPFLLWTRSDRTLQRGAQAGFSGTVTLAFTSLGVSGPSWDVGEMTRLMADLAGTDCSSFPWRAGGSLLLSAWVWAVPVAGRWVPAAGGVCGVPAAGGLGIQLLGASQGLAAGCLGCQLLGACGCQLLGCLGYLLLGHLVWVLASGASWDACCWDVSGAGCHLPRAGLWALTAFVLFRLRQFTSGGQRRLLPGWSTSVSVSIRTSSRGTTSGALSSCTWSGGTSRYFHIVSWEPALGFPALPSLSPPSDLATPQHQGSPHGSLVRVSG